MMAYKEVTIYVFQKTKLRFLRSLIPPEYVNTRYKVTSKGTVEDYYLTDVDYMYSLPEKYHENNNFEKTEMFFLPENVYCIAGNVNFDLQCPVYEMNGKYAIQKTGKRKLFFPLRLYIILSDESFHEFIEWSADGGSFRIKNNQGLVDKLTANDFSSGKVDRYSF